MSLLQSLKGVFLIIVSTLLAASVSGCVDYTNRYEGVTLRAGDAQYANAAIQTVDPWPPESNRTTIDTYSQKSAEVIKTYAGSEKTAGATSN